MLVLHPKVRVLARVRAARTRAHAHARVWDCVNAVLPNLFPLGSAYRAKRTKHKAQAAASPSPH